MNYCLAAFVGTLPWLLVSALVLSLCY